MIGMVGEARTDFEGEGMIWLNGESWKAQSSLGIKKGDKVKILSIAGLNLIVEPLKEGF
jgi:membrane-bound serine protease (ClpP class)